MAQGIALEKLSTHLWVVIQKKQKWWFLILGGESGRLGAVFI
jgi:hypothetical protein